MIRVAIVDDHPAVRLGLKTALAAEPGLVPVGAGSSAAALGPLLYRTDPDVVLLDYQLPDGDGLTLCRELKVAVPARKVILYSAFADASMTVPAIVPGSAPARARATSPPRSRSTTASSRAACGGCSTGSRSRSRSMRASRSSRPRMGMTPHCSAASVVPTLPPS